MLERDTENEIKGGQRLDRELVAERVKDAGYVLELLRKAIEQRGADFNYLQFFRQGETGGCRYVWWEGLDEPRPALESLGIELIPTTAVEHIYDLPDNVESGDTCPACPACLVGEVLWLAGTSLTELAQNEGSAGADVADALGWSAEAAYMLNIAQEVQDLGLPWGRSLHWAERWLAVHREILSKNPDLDLSQSGFNGTAWCRHNAGVRLVLSQEGLSDEMAPHLAKREWVETEVSI